MSPGAWPQWTGSTVKTVLFIISSVFGDSNCAAMCMYIDAYAGIVYTTQLAMNAYCVLTRVQRYSLAH